VLGIGTINLECFLIKEMILFEKFYFSIGVSKNQLMNLLSDDLKALVSLKNYLHLNYLD